MEFSNYETILRAEKKLPRKDKGEEHKIQTEFFNILRMSESKNPTLKYIFAIPNGSKRSIGVAKKLKAEGVKRGVPDVAVPISSQPYAGMFIEFKSEK
jgi:hypothetical protein